MTTLQTLCQFLGDFAPTSLAEDWDNVGLLVGDRTAEVRRVMTCLTVTPASAAEAVEHEADLIVTHHPFPFRPLKQLTADTTVGKILLQLVQANIAIYSPHTSFDSAAAGINQRLAEGLGLTNIQPLIPREPEADSLGAGRFGSLDRELSADEFVQIVKRFLRISGLHLVADEGAQVRRVAVACGSAGQFLDQALRVGCDTFVTGETNFHTCLEAEAKGVSLLLPGHYASERFALECLADTLQQEFPTLSVWACRTEADPLRWV